VADGSGRRLSVLAQLNIQPGSGGVTGSLTTSPGR
jgi:hypothetical protein